MSSGGVQLHRLHSLFYGALTTGMRRAELLGLHWSDIKVAREGAWAVLHARRIVVEPEDVPMAQDVETTRSKRRGPIDRNGYPGQATPAAVNVIARRLAAPAPS